MQHFLDFMQLSDTQIRTLLDQVRAYNLHTDDPAHRELLKGKVIANLFYEASTRTRVS